MGELLFQILEQAGIYAVFVSLIVNILVSIIGVLPSVFITASNLLFFGLYFGLLVSIIGEAIGAIISFMLYRKGLKKWRLIDSQHTAILKLKNLEGKNAFWMIVSLRILPFIPSGVVTLGSSFSKVSLGLFAFASTIGKIPSLLIEAGAVYGFMQVGLELKIGIIVIIICFLIWKIKNLNK